MARVAARRRAAALVSRVMAGSVVGNVGGDTLVTAAQTLPLPTVELRNLTVSYRQHPALHHLSGRFASGSLTAVIGPKPNLLDINQVNPPMRLAWVE